MAPTYTYSLHTDASGQYLRLVSVGGTFDANTDLVLDTGFFNGVEYPVKEIVNNSVFSNNTSARTNLRSITMNNLTTLSGSTTFRFCTGLTSVSFPSLITFSGTNTFNGCTSLTNFGLVDLGSTITTYPASTFQNCRFVDIILPSQITSLGNSVFASNTALLSFSGPNLTSIGTGTFSGCTSLTNFGLVDLGSTITTFLDYTFSACGFVTVNLPNNITTLGQAVFYNCSLLQGISGENITTISHTGSVGTFEGCSTLSSVSFPNLTTISGSYTFYNCKSLTSVSFPSLTTCSVCNNTFQDCTGLTSVSFPSLTTISGSYTFSGCTSLTNFTQVNLGSIITTYPNYIFQGCSFVNITLPSQITSLGNYVFASNTALQSFSGPNLTSIGTNTFNGCTSLTNFGLVDLGSTITTYPNFTFQNCRFVTITLPSQITSLGNSVFAGNTALLSFSGPNLTSIGTNTFEGCTNLVTCVLGTITSFPALLFNNCSSLHNLYIRSTSSPSLTNANTFNGTNALYFIFIRSIATWSGFTAKTPQPVSVPSVTVTQSLGSTLLTVTATSSLPSGYTIPYYTYQWYKNGLAINGATSATYIAFTNDTYYVRVTDPLLQTTQSLPITIGQIITYTVLANGTAIITGCGLSGAIKLMYISGPLSNGALSNIPSSSAYPITQIDAGAFLGQTGITGVAAPFVTTVGASAFSGCTALAYLYIGIASGVPTFGTGCFTGCTALTSNVFKNVYNTEWTADPSPSGTGLNTYRPLTVTVVASEISAPIISLTPVVQSGGTASKSTPILTTLYNYYVNGVRTQTDIAAPVTQLLSIRKDAYFLTAGNVFETNTAVSTGGSQGVSKFTGGKGKMTMYIGQ